MHALDRGKIDIDPAQPGCLRIMVPDKSAHFAQNLFPQQVDITVLFRNRNKKPRRDQFPIVIPDTRQRFRCNHLPGAAVDNRLQEHLCRVLIQCLIQPAFDLNMPVEFLQHFLRHQGLLDVRAVPRFVQRIDQQVHDPVRRTVVSGQSDFHISHVQVQIRSLRLPGCSEAFKDSPADSFPVRILRSGHAEISAAQIEKQQIRKLPYQPTDDQAQSLVHLRAAVHASLVIIVPDRKAKDPAVSPVQRILQPFGEGTRVECRPAVGNI